MQVQLPLPGISRKVVFVLLMQQIKVSVGVRLHQENNDALISAEKHWIIIRNICVWSCHAEKRDLSLTWHWQIRFLFSKFYLKHSSHTYNFPVYACLCAFHLSTLKTILIFTLDLAARHQFMQVVQHSFIAQILSASQ